MTVQPISATTLTGRAETLRAELANRIVNRMQVEGKIETGVPGFFLYRRNAPSDCISAAYEPELVVFVQGEKRINLGRTVHVCTGANFLLTSIDLPVVSQVIKATVEEPIAGVTLAGGAWTGDSPALDIVAAGGPTPTPFPFAARFGQSDSVMTTRLPRSIPKSTSARLVSSLTRRWRRALRGA